MDALYLVDGEIRSMMRNAIERIVGVQFSKKEKYQDILLKVSIRVVSSLLAIYLFAMIKDNVDLKKNTSLVFIAIFVYFVYDEMNNSKDNSN